MSGHLVELLEELLCVVVVIGMFAAVLRRRAVPARRAAGFALAAVAFVCAAGHLGSDNSGLRQDRQIKVSARAGVDWCFRETGSLSEVPFVNWVRARIPARAVYLLDDLAPQPDGWCLTLALLPALPAGPGDDTPRWEIAFGGYPPALKARIARHDPSVSVYSSGFALARIGAA